MYLTQVSQCSRLVVAVSELAQQVGCAPVGGYGLVEVAQTVVGEAEAPPGGGLAVVIVELLEQA